MTLVVSFAFSNMFDHMNSSGMQYKEIIGTILVEVEWWSNMPVYITCKDILLRKNTAATKWKDSTRKFELNQSLN